MLKIALLQFNPIVGNVADNLAIIIASANKAAEDGCDILLTPELAICGYPPEDLLFSHDFCHQCEEAVNKLCAIKNITIVCGTPYLDCERIYNSAVVVQNGEVVGRYFKRNLPNYGVFDEKRYFAQGEKSLVFKCNDNTIGLAICEDIWGGELDHDHLVNVDLLLTLNASPFATGKYDQRLTVVKTLAQKYDLPVFYLNLIGGQDELVFDGASFVINANSSLAGRLAPFNQELAYFTYDKEDKKVVVGGSYNLGSMIDSLDLNSGAYKQLTKVISCSTLFKAGAEYYSQKVGVTTNDGCENNYPDELTSIYLALVLAIRDYVEKNNIAGVVLGLSGGIDSALTLVLAVDALSHERVFALMMPSRYTAEISNLDASEMVNTLKVRHQVISIEDIAYNYDVALKPLWNRIAGLNGNDVDVTSENIQARVRGNLVMALANKLRYIGLATGNKSELATGYCTLYGDMAGGFAPLKDLFKTMVYKLSNWRNQFTVVIPKRIITRAPSAELRYNQTDQDSLPDYAILDQILELLISKKQSQQQIIEQGFAADIVAKVLRLVVASEFKRSQAACGPKVTDCAFGREWRYPLTKA